MIFFNISIIQYGQIIADHTIVDRYDDIPQQWIDVVKTMWVTNPGESHAAATRQGLSDLEALNSRFQVIIRTTGTPDSYRTNELRFSGVTWGDFSHATGWIYNCGEEDWFTNSTGRARTKAGITYCNTHSLDLAAIGFGWCYDDSHTGSISSTTDPVFGCRWYGRSLESPSGSRSWGLDAADQAITGNVVSLDTYLAATQEYIDYCNTQGYETKVYFTTGPVEPTYYVGEAGYQASLKHQRIRDYVKSDPTRILFDYADILCYDDGSEVIATSTWNGHIFPVITQTNYGDASLGHIDSPGALRLAKAMWWMLARIAGWDGGTGIPSGTWLGVTTDWHDDVNWPAEIPTSTTDVIISSSVTNQPFVFESPAAICNNLTVGTGASLTVNAGQSLTVRGNLTNSGTVNLESGFSNDEPVGLTLNGSMIVAGTSTGNVTYKRMLRPKGTEGDRHFFSSPVGGQLIASFTAANSIDIEKVGTVYQIWEWRESDGTWPIVSAGTFVTGKGYNLSQASGGDGLLTFTGPVVKSATFTASSPYITGYVDRATSFDYGLNNDNLIWTAGRSWTDYGGGGWNLMGNPFTSAMDAAVFISSNAGKFDPYYEALYVYDGLNDRYEYAAASIPGYRESGSFGSVVQAGQGFFVLALYDKIVFNFNSSMQVHNTAVTMLKSAAVEDPWPGLQLKVRYGSDESMTTIVYNSEMTAGLDPGFDVGQFSAGPDVEIYTALVSKENDVHFARQALPLTDSGKNIISVGIDSEKGGEVIFSAFSVPLANSGFWLEDRKAGIFTDLNSSSYRITLPANTYGTGRFFIYASANMPTGVKNPQDVTELRVWTYNGKIIIKGQVSETATCEVYDLQGQKVLISRLTDGDLNIVELISVSRGVFLVRVADGTKIYNRKVALL